MLPAFSLTPNGFANAATPPGRSAGMPSETGIGEPYVPVQWPVLVVARTRDAPLSIRLLTRVFDHWCPVKMDVARQKSLHNSALNQILFGFDLNGTTDFRDVFRVPSPEKFACISARRCSRRSWTSYLGRASDASLRVIAGTRGYARCHAPSSFA